MTISIRTPAGRLVEQFGVQKLAHWSGRHRARVHAWLWPKSKGGTGGAVPLAVRSRIILAAEREDGIVLTHADFEPRTGETYLTDAGVAI